ncbi:hypothetical protein [Georgenia sp. MJ170]|uniref:hypothetical protein n=1 Tax=Georgenia sunbinii TaxID=3117728 RepID=UPI002F269D9E
MLGTCMGSAFGEGTGYPLGIAYTIGVFGLFLLPIAVRWSIDEFRGRGWRGS